MEPLLPFWKFFRGKKSFARKKIRRINLRPYGQA